MLHVADDFLKLIVQVVLALSSLWPAMRRTWHTRPVERRVGMRRVQLAPALAFTGLIPSRIAVCVPRRITLPSGLVIPDRRRMERRGL